jgi:hypothetical protein
MDSRPQPLGEQARAAGTAEAAEEDASYSEIDDTVDRHRRSVRLAIAAGGLLALAIVAAAFLLRPSAGTDEVAPVVAAPVETVVATAPERVDVPGVVSVRDATLPEEPPVMAPLPADDGPGAIRLRVGPNLAPERREQIAAALEAEGYGPVRLEVLPFPIAASRVGYYREEDEGAATSLAAFISGVLDDGGIDVSTRDYGKLLSDTEPGRLDVWIEG